MNNVIYDVAKRTNNEIFLGIVGSVRSGKSTFIRRFMELKVLPFVENDLVAMITDEMPQSGDGKQIMTVEPKFVPSTQVEVKISEDITFKTRLVDCVGFIIDGSTGYLNQDGSERLVQTPWYSEGIPFGEAASLGTKKVIENHTNIGIVITSDGSFGSFTRADYEHVEEDVINELKALNKPFVIVLNTTRPNDEQTLALCEMLKVKYDNEVVACDVKNMNELDIDNILTSALKEFEITDIEINIPSWLDVLSEDSKYKHKFNDIIKDVSGNYRKIKNIYDIINELKETKMFESVEIEHLDKSTGEIALNIVVSDTLYDDVLADLIGLDTFSKAALLTALNDYQKMKETYDLFGKAKENLSNNPTSMVMPKLNDLTLCEPELIKGGQRYGVKLNAQAPVIILTKINIESTFAPIIGSNEQANTLIEHMKKVMEEDEKGIWNLEVFGRKLSDVIFDGIYSKVSSDNYDTLTKFREALEKVLNHDQGKVIALML